MVKLPKIAYDWLLTAKENGLSLSQAISIDYTDSFNFDTWLATDDSHIKDFACAWCGDDVEIISDMFRAYYVDSIGIRHYIKADYNSSTDKQLAVLFTETKWRAIFPKAFNNGFLQFEKVGGL